MHPFKVFKPAPHIEEIQDQSLIKKIYKYWRIRTFYAIYIGYACYYLSRKSFVFIIPALQSELGMGKVELGLISSILSLSYGVSKFVSGIMGDRSNPRYFMSIGLIITGILNIVFGFSSVWWAFAIFWGLNGWFQGWGWPSCAKLLTCWYSQSERGRWWSACNTSLNVGGALVPLLVAFCAQHFGWRSAMYIPGTLCILSGFFIMNRLRDTPQSLGLPAIEKFRNDYVDGKSKLEKATISIKEMLREYIFCNKFLWILAISYFFIYLIRTAINDWSMLYLIEVRNYTKLQAGFCVCWFEIGGFLGGIVAGWASDVLFKGKRNPVIFIFTAAIFLSILAFKFISTSWPTLDATFLYSFGFFIFGPQMLIGVAAAELSHKQAAATSTGFVSCFAYLGAAVAGGPLGGMIKLFGWNSFLLTLATAAVIAALLILPLWSVKTNPNKKLLSTRN